ncbi:hypothetical protein QJS10_CPA06g01448 [Acorus calamus]|uniref:Uncharacterized protein n=1 Tax=Acorus calamus TaxID=4465 RepID=A0AAV9EN09_ACOCL|nr:hypothetical protein QJS10_CPA06g01448 [Acorus calamus]
MDHRKACSILLMILFAVVVLRSGGADASRVLFDCAHEEGGGSSAHPSLYIKARSSVIELMGQLTRGQNPGGKGH